MAAEWWDPKGKFRPLHQIGPVRLQFIRDELTRHFKIESAGMKPLTGLSIADIGCGGGLISEPLTRLGAKVTGIDPATRNIEIARLHAEPQGLEIDYRPITVEELAAEGRQYDAAVCLEVVEHVPDPAAFIKECARLVRPGGMLILSTINRTFKAYALAIVGAEYVLGWLPRGTHDWNRFITPDELSRHIGAAGLRDPAELHGLRLRSLARPLAPRPGYGRQLSGIERESVSAGSDRVRPMHRRRNCRHDHLYVRRMGSDPQGLTPVESRSSDPQPVRHARSDIRMFAPSDPAYRLLIRPDESHALRQS